MALGASRNHILWVAARAALASTAIGIALGSLVELFLRRILETWMNTRSEEITSLLGVVIPCAACACSACLLPARRAAAVHPIDALLHE
jgi:ABC-type antimicrobial peptide transport system permease subunit